MPVRVRSCDVEGLLGQIVYIDLVDQDEATARATLLQGIDKAINKRRNIVYLPSFWRSIMFIVESIPEPLFKRLSL